MGVKEARIEQNTINKQTNNKSLGNLYLRFTGPNAENYNSWTLTPPSSLTRHITLRWFNRALCVQYSQTVCLSFLPDFDELQSTFNVAFIFVAQGLNRVPCSSHANRKNGSKEERRMHERRWWRRKGWKKEMGTMAYLFPKVIVKVKW